MKTMSLPQAAMQIATIAHKDQKRKYTNDPYILHPGEVAGIAATFSHDDYALRHYLATAWLHDVIEDCGYTAESLYKELVALTDDHFACEHVVGRVMLLSDLEEGNRATRKALTIQRLSKADRLVQTVKCADILSNLSSIMEHDKKFAVLYIKETTALVTSFEEIVFERTYTLEKLKEAKKKLFEVTTL